MSLYKSLRSKAVSSLRSVLMRSSYNFDELMSCLRVHTPPIFVECPTLNDGDILLSGTALLGSSAFG